MLALSRYVVLNPVRAQMVTEAGDWPWSSYRATIGREVAPVWLDTDWLLAQFGQQRMHVVQAYIRFVRDGMGQPSPWDDLCHQVWLGDETFVARFQNLKQSEELREIPKRQRRSLVKSLLQYQQEYPQRDEAMARAYHTGVYTMQEIGDFFGVHYMTVSRAVRRLRPNWSARKYETCSQTVLSTKLDDVEKEVFTTVHRFGGWLSGTALSLCGHVDGDE